MTKLSARTGVLAIAAALVASPHSAARQLPRSTVQIDRDDIGGSVLGPRGPEPGVWVVAETTDLPTRFAKIVVTDDTGRYLVPDLPNARYSVWVRGYGLVDSPKVPATPGTLLDLHAVAAPNAAAAAQYYPPVYWFSMMHVPAAREFPLPKIKSQGEWLNIVKTGACQSCHALGTPGTRTISPALGVFATSAEAWQRRIRSGQAQALMARDITRLDTQIALQLLGDWTDRIAAGELPFAKPERPRGIERNIVITQWDWGSPTAYLHDEISTDRRNPRVNANGKIYGSPEDSSDFVPILDPKTNAASEVLHPVRDPKTPSTKANPMAPSAYWGPDPIWDGKTLNHNPMMDEKGRVWFTPRVRPDANPDFCKQGSEHPSARAFPLEQSGRHLSMFDPATGTFTLISTCFPTHHLNFASDANQTLWTSAGIGGPGVIGWLNRKMFEETHDEIRSQGWTPFVVDTNHNGKRDGYVEPGQPEDPAKDTRVAVNTYAVAVSPADGSVWGTVVGYRGYIVRLVPGSDPTHTALTEIYEPPAPGFGPRGGDVDGNGVYWVSLASGHLASFDRRRCRPNMKPMANGQTCSEGWTLYQLPGPQLRDVTDPGSAEASYYTWIDRFGVFGLGRNVPIAMGNLNSSIFALVDGRFVNFVLPYPMGFFAKNVDARIDDPNAGWKGRALWSTYGTRTMFHLEGGTGNRPKAVRIQLRPTPLAR
jgi:hypothetical protein